MQSTRTTRDVHIEALSRFKWVFYFVALLMVVPPVVDFGLNVLPWRPGQIQWRYGAVGLVSGFLMTTVLGAAMVAGLAAWFGHRWIQRITGILWLIFRRPSRSGLRRLHARHASAARRGTRGAAVDLRCRGDQSRAQEPCGRGGASLAWHCGGPLDATPTRP